MPSKKSNIERLAEANILNTDHFSDHEQKVIESMDDNEIEVLIKLRKKMGEAPAGKEHMRPNFPV